MERERIDWIDVLKFMGIYAVFMIHLGKDVGRMYDFAFVCFPLFFFVSGFLAKPGKTLSEVIRKRFRQLVLPYIFFAVLSMIFIIFSTEKDFMTYLGYLKQFVLGIRNQLYAPALWFLPCLFCVSIIFEILKRILKKDGLVFLAAVGIYLCSVTLFPNNPSVTPSWIFNLDSACYYLIVYVSGYVFRKLSEKDKAGNFRYGVMLRGIGAIVLTIYALLLYMQKDILGLWLSAIPGIALLLPVVKIILLIGFLIILAKLLAVFPTLAHLGSNTLWLCGNEFIVKQILKSAVSLLGWKIEITDVVSGTIYAVIAMCVVVYVLMPAEKVIYRRFCDIPEAIVNVRSKVRE